VLRLPLSRHLLLNVVLSPVRGLTPSQARQQAYEAGRLVLLSHKAGISLKQWGFSKTSIFEKPNNINNLSNW